MAYRRSSSPSSDDSNDVNESDSNNITNVFCNDGSFLEMFKRMQNNMNSKNTEDKAETSTVDKQRPNADVTESVTPKPPPFPGRRRCMKVLPVGKVKKLKTEDESKKSTTTDAWAKYLEEVKKYKETYCDGESKNRSLVK